MQGPVFRAMYPTMVLTTRLERWQEYNPILSRLFDTRYGFETTKDVIQGEYLGFNDVHTDPELRDFYADIVESVRTFLKIYALRTEYFDYYVTRSAFSLLDKQGQNMSPHVHQGADVSFVYYVEAPEGTNAFQVINENAHTIADGLFSSFRGVDRSLISEINPFNCAHTDFNPTPGDLYVFLASTLHGVGSIDNYKSRRISLAGDVSLVLKPEHKAYEYGKPPLERWIQF